MRSKELHMNLYDLYEQLGQLIEADEANGERLVLGVHQETYPLQENVGGIYDPYGDDELCQMGGRWICTRCEDAISETGELTEAWVSTDEDGDLVYMHDQCRKEYLEEQPIYIVLNGSPYGLSPYGPRKAWGGGF